MADIIHTKRQEYLTSGISGLKNLGNSCYLNSILQCLSSLDLFRTWIINDESFKPQLKKNAHRFKNESVTLKLCELFNHIWKNYDTVSPRSLKKIMGQVCDQFQNTEQQDSHEFLNSLLDTVHEETCEKVVIDFKNIQNDVMGYMLFTKFISPSNALIKYDTFMDFYENEATDEDKAYHAKVLNEYREKYKDTVEIYEEYRYWMTNDLDICIKEKRDVVTIFNAYKYWKQYVEHSHSIITDLFTGLYYSNVKCGKCDCITDTFEPFTILTLPINESGESTIDESLNEFTKEEVLIGDNQFYCTKCKENVNALKKMYIWELPKILIVQLKRFKHTIKVITPEYSTNTISKITTKVTFPFKDLDLKNQTSHLRNAKSTKYDLVATSNHSGTYNGGHYVSFCKNSVNNHWYKYDDDDVFCVLDDTIEEEAMPKDAYILFYVRQ